ncbi:MAG: hypothetical protein WHS64_04805 [Fervidobacterium sp.]|uniref:Uncharacterized protein n=1 Tax=Fervidobacterium gondwanense DSM 13020 TaxID=1121883 RepID=A0A1M7TCG4_FERGO|nr:hypothetical protein [Fervidobacterium gondwanense]UXF01756.1 hypothetical protein IB67_09580 [Fervidobacterium riparium]SHN68348.1 hypothetical protein SAMN02745226_01825 [Fervidobacterium gondwanense DSM 13020]
MSLRKLLSFLLLTILLLTVSFADALKFLPKDYSMLVYVPDLPKAYDAFKALPIGQTLLADTGIGLESLVLGVLEQQLLSMKYTLSDFDLFTKEMLVTTDKEGNITVVLGPVKNTTKVRKVLESFLEQETLKKVKFVENYFVYSDVQVGGGKVPANLSSTLKGNLGVTYTNIVDKDISFEGYGYIRVENNALVLYQKIDAKTQAAKNALKTLQNTKPVDVLGDKNVGGDLLIFVNRQIPEALKKSTLDALLSVANITNVSISGVMYASADIGSAVSSLLSADSQSQTSNQSNQNNQNVSVSSYSVVFGSGFKMPEEVKKYVTIGSEKYGVLTTENGMESYLLIKNDRMITYTVAPNKYKPGDKTFFTANYDPKYFMGVFINFEPLINTMLGKKIKSSATFVAYVEGDSIIQKGTVK